jgi:hypothetical protein
MELEKKTIDADSFLKQVNDLQEHSGACVKGPLLMVNIILLEHYDRR